MMDAMREAHAGVSPGIDAEQVSRFRRHRFGKEKEKRFWEGIFTPRELARLAKFKDPYPHAAGVFTAKEAVIKSLSAFGKKTSFRDIEIRHEKDGRPRTILRTAKGVECRVSISHTGDLACAVALCRIIRVGTSLGNEVSK